jgi:hypothetical protein
MNARFLRDEAARFRGMAGDADRETTKLRLLAMAAEYDARAEGANQLTAPESDPGNAYEAVEPTTDETPNFTPGGKVATGSKETVVVPRRPVGRPRRE